MCFSPHHTAAKIKQEGGIILQKSTQHDKRDQVPPTFTNSACELAELDGSISFTHNSHGAELV